VIDLALREAVAHDDESIHPEHLALGLIRVGEGVGFEIVQSAEPDLKEVCRRLTSALDAARSDPLVEESPPFRVAELRGDAEDWEAQLNDAGAAGYEIVAVVDGRVILRRP
jgi:ATP-dependent Clp protease ATP-binding subunit ClpA